MCFYQPNPPGCSCAFHQLIQPCPSATTYPPPEPTKNPNPLVKVCGMREFAKGVGMRICLGCQSRYAGNMGAGVGVGMGGRLGYNVTLEMGYTGFNSPGWNAGQQNEQKTSGALKKDKAGFMELAMERMVATETAPAAMPGSETGTVFAAGPGTGPKTGTTCGCSLMVRRGEPKPDSRRMVTYPNLVSRAQTAVSLPIPESAKEAANEIPMPTPTPMPHDLGIRKDTGENQGQVQECSQVMGELEKAPESQSRLLQYDPVPKATVESFAPGAERRLTTATARKTGAETCDGKDNTVAEKNTEEDVSNLPRIEEERVMKIDNESQVGMNDRHGSMDESVERLAMTLA